MDYYDAIAEGYDELHREEQLEKLAIIRQHLRITPKTKLLDVGCGTGISSDFPCEVMGIDPSAKLLAKNPYPHVQGNAESLPFKDHEFDIVISVSAIQNFNDLPKALEEIRRVGNDTYVLSFLKNSSKADYIEDEIRNVFHIKKKIVEKKDIILLIGSRIID